MDLLRRAVRNDDVLFVYQEIILPLENVAELFGCGLVDCFVASVRGLVRIRSPDQLRVDIEIFSAQFTRGQREEQEQRPAENPRKWAAKKSPHYCTIVSSRESSSDSS